MPKKLRKNQAATTLQPVRQALRRLEREGAGLVARLRQDVTRHLTVSQRRALTNFLRQARRTGGDIERRIKRSRRELEASAEKIIAGMEQRAVRALTTAIRRFRLVTQAELRRIELRLAQLESGGERLESPRTKQQALSLEREPGQTLSDS